MIRVLGALTQIAHVKDDSKINTCGAKQASFRRYLVKNACFAPQVWATLVRDEAVKPPRATLGFKRILATAARAVGRVPRIHVAGIF